MKTILSRLSDKTIKRRARCSHIAYQLARRVVRAFENNDVDMDTNGEKWLVTRVAASGIITAVDVGANTGEWVTSVLLAAPKAQVLVRCLNAARLIQSFGQIGPVISSSVFAC